MRRDRQRHYRRSWSDADQTRSATQTGQEVVGDRSTSPLDDISTCPCPQVHLLTSVLCTCSRSLSILIRQTPARRTGLHGAHRPDRFVLGLPRWHGLLWPSRGRQHIRQQSGLLSHQPIGIPEDVQAVLSLGPPMVRGVRGPSTGFTRGAPPSLGAAHTSSTTVSPPTMPPDGPCAQGAVLLVRAVPASQSRAVTPPHPNPVDFGSSVLYRDDTGLFESNGKSGPCL